MMKSRRLHVLVLIVVFFGAAPAPWGVAQSRDVETVTPVDVELEILAAFREEKYEKAAELIERHLERSPRDVTMLYNAACAYSRLGERDKAADYLYRAVSHGFIDFAFMERDPDLESIRDHAVYIRILEMRNEAYARLAVNQLDRAKEQFGEDGYLYECDEERRLNYATALDEVSYREMRRMLERQADHQIATLFEAAPDYYTLIAVPRPDMAAVLIDDPEIGGIYEHPRRRLIARDIGVMLRHEFTHLLHYGHMERLRQLHPLWMQEGIAALYENYELSASGRIRFLHNSRHNIIKRLVERNHVVRWEDLFEMKAERFMARAGQNYPQVRSIFQFLADSGKLESWYRTYVEKYGEDRTGRVAFETVFEKPLNEVEAAWRAWVRKQPYLDEFVGRGDASLGIQTSEDTANDGVVIERVLPGSAADRAGLLVGDVIVALDDSPTRSFRELVTIIASKSVGDAVRVRLRRGGRYLTIPVILKPLQALLPPEADTMPPLTPPRRAAA